jgi:adenylosuccinate lyase
VALPDSLLIGHYQATMAADLVQTLTVFGDRMQAAVYATHGLAFSSAVLADLTSGGVEREHAYRSVQAAANRSAASGADFGQVLQQEGIELGSLRPERFLVHHGVILNRLELLRGMQD